MVPSSILHPCLQEYNLVINPCTELHTFWWKAYSMTYQGLCWRWGLWWLMLETHASLVTLRTFCLPVTVYLLTIVSFLFFSACDWRSSVELSACNFTQKIAICTLQTDKQMECPAIKSSDQWDVLGMQLVRAAVKWTCFDFHGSLCFLLNFYMLSLWLCACLLVQAHSS